MCKENKNESVTLASVLKQGKILQLLDGRCIQMQAGQNTTTCTWYGSMCVEIEDMGSHVVIHDGGITVNGNWADFSNEELEKYEAELNE
ncbi:hypothetical protein BVX99_03085 [bacterium F16]|nr:hypothetical protein BVX99_03085 [bacterium F16]